MENVGNNPRRELHVLLDHIPDKGVSAALEYLRSLMDPVELALLNAPEDDEPLSAHERAAIEQAAHRNQRGDAVITHGEVLREFGLDR